MIRSRDGLNILLTMGENVRAERIPNVPDVITERLPPDHPIAVQAFLSHWAPDTITWIWGGLRPNLLLDASARGIPLLLVDAGQDGFDGRRDRWLPEVPRRLLARFDARLARSEAAHLRLAQLGCPLEEIVRVPPLQPVGHTLHASQSDIDEMRAGLTGRHVWYARQVSRMEIPIVLAAHKQALRHAHRLLLVLEPVDPADLNLCHEQIQALGLHATRWSGGEMPNQAESILIVDEPGDDGLWLSVAPITYLGQSMDTGGQGLDPYEAAAHGSSILYGPNVRGFLRSYSRLAASGAARIVSDESSLGNAVGRLVAPDQAARMAMAAWDVITEGAAATDRVIELVNTTLDARVAGQG